MYDWKSVQLHVFFDASEKAFSAVAYFRFEKADICDCALVLARTRVAPLKPMSIPRLELQAAVLASRVSRTIINEHEIQVDAVHCWTDSRTVLCWIRSDARKFKTFVAHRVGEIEELTDVKDWHWVPTKDNVVDDATRNNKPADLSKESRWWHGPEFLRLNLDQWPTETEEKAMKEKDLDLESKVKQVNLVTNAQLDLPDVKKFSSWLKLVRTTAWILRFLTVCRNKVRSTTDELVPTEYTAAEELWWKKVQLDSFLNELQCLKEKRPLPSSSRLIQLSPVLDERGVMRIKG